MSQLCSDFANLGQNFRRKRSEHVPVLFMTCKREHLRAESHEFDAIFIIPLEHLDHITSIGQAQGLYPLFTSCYIWLFSLIGSIFGSMLWF